MFKTFSCCNTLLLKYAENFKFKITTVNKSFDIIWYYNKHFMFYIKNYVFTINNIIGIPDLSFAESEIISPEEFIPPPIIV